MFSRAKMKTTQIKIKNMKLNMTQKTVTAIVLFAINTFLCFTAEAQWKTKYYVDDFGDPTDQKYESMTATGFFNNSATTKSEATYSFVKDEKSLLINVYEYGRRLASNVEATFEVVKIKQPSGDVVTIQNVFFTKSGKLYFSKSNFEQIVDAIKDSGSYTMVFERTGKYSKSGYVIKFDID